MERKSKIALFSVVSNTVLTILKFIVGILSGSVSIISEAIHSAMDLVASVITYFSVKMASKPADREHPYGHGKIENISGVIEGMLILVAAALILIEAVENMFSGQEIKITYLGIGVMFFASIVNYFVSKKLYQVAKEEDSIALEGDALHLKTDIYTSFGVGIGLILIAITKIHMLDSILAIIVALFILKESFELIKKAFEPLVDTKLPEDEEKLIEKVLENYRERILDFCYLRTRKSGSNRYIEFHILIDGNLKIKEGHDLCEEIESEIEKQLSNTNIHIHLEPA